MAERFTTMSRPAVSQHIGVLRAAGLLDERREGTRRLYRTRTNALTPVQAYLDRFWPDHLTRLKRIVEHDLTKEQP